MVVDTSAMLAIVFEEPEAERYAQLLVASRRSFMSAVSRLEASIVVEARKGRSSGRDFDRFLAAARIEIVPFDGEQAVIALDGWKRFGKGRRPAGLNLGDCCAYALSRIKREPLLFKGADFAKTDVVGASPRVRPAARSAPHSSPRTRTSST